MKLKQLTIDNIASIEHAVINFDSEPLAGEHLFLVTGETGSGKSTILDCLCLALYGNTPRLDAARKDKYDSSANTDTLMTDDVKQLLRRGCVNANVTLTFDDNNGIPYIATWHIHRAHNKPGNRIMEPERTLQTDENVTPPVFLRKKTEINLHITRLTGLDMSQFFRTVVLAQGKFSEFLNSDENEKARLLEKMTGTEVYAQIGKKIYETCREKENERDHLQSQLKDIIVLSDEEKSQITQEVATLGNEQAMVSKRAEETMRMLKWLDEKEKNERALEAKRQELERLQEEATRSKIGHQRQLVTDWEATVDARHDLAALRLASTRVKTLQQRLPTMQDEYARLCAALRSFKHNIAAQQNRLRDVEDFLLKEKPNSGMYKDINAIKNQLRLLNTEQANRREFSLALTQEQERLPQVEATVMAGRDALERQNETIKTLEDKYRQLDVDKITVRKDDLTRAKQAIETLQLHQHMVMQAIEAISQLKADLQQEEQTLERAQNSLDDKRQLKAKAQAAVERETDWLNLLEQAHKSLHAGDTCPVCGNLITQLQPCKGENALESLRTQLRQAEQNLQKTETEIAAALKAIKQLNRQIAHFNDELAQKTTDRDKQRLLATGQMEKCGIDSSCDFDDDKQAAGIIAGINAEITVLADILKNAGQLNDRIGKERGKLAELNAAHHQATIELNTVAQSITHRQAAIEASEERSRSAISTLNELITLPDWRQRLSQDNDFINELERKANLYQHNEATAQRLTHDIAKSQALIPMMEDIKNHITGLAEGAEARTEIPGNLDEQWRAFESKYMAWLKDLNDGQQEIERSRQAVNNYLTAHYEMTLERLTTLNGYRQSDIQAIHATINAMSDKIKHTQGEISTLVNNRDDIAAGRPAMSEENREKLNEIYQTCQSQYESLTGQIASLMARIKADEANKNAMSAKKQALDKAEESYREWAVMCDHLGSADGKTFRKIAQSYMLGELLNTANGYLRQFNDRYELEANPGTLTILAHDLLQGGLTSVNTLSGGESFMVSLALALALSSTTGKIFSLDTLFIDEGFGTLSENYLDHVMDTLNRLYDMGGRRVGIISHVELLKERIPTQIKVERDSKNNTVSRVRVVRDYSTSTS